MQLTTHTLIDVLKTTLFACREVLGDEVSALQIQTLAVVMTEPGILQKDLPKRLQVSGSAVSRNTTSLEKVKRDKQAGPDFLAKRRSQDDPRRFELHPTPKAWLWLDTVADKVRKEHGVQIDTERLAVILKAFMAFMRAITDTDVCVYRVLMLLCVLERPGIEQAALMDATRIPVKAAVSRNLLNLSTFKTNKEPGADLVEQRIDPLHRKQNRIYPTIKAQHWFETVLEQVNSKLLKLENK